MRIRSVFNAPEILKPRFPAFLCAVFLCLSAALAAQSDLSLWGYITDFETGAPIAGARLELKPGGEKAFSDQTGRYEFRCLRAGAVTLSAAADSYLANHKHQVEIEAGRSQRVDIALSKKYYLNEDQLVVGERPARTDGMVIIAHNSPQFRQARNLGELLEYLPGIVIISGGGLNQTATVSVGGAPARQTGIYLDGVKLNSQTTGDFDLNSIPKEMIERIEFYPRGSAD